MLVKAAISYVFKTEQPFSYIGHYNCSAQWYRMFFCKRTVTKKSYYIWVLNRDQAYNLPMKHLVFNCSATVKPLYSNNPISKDALFKSSCEHKHKHYIKFLYAVRKFEGLVA